MSMLRCDVCERPVDTDLDPDALIDTSPTTTACRWCREKAEAEKKEG